MIRQVFLPYSRGSTVDDLPPVCMKCGAPATRHIKLTFLGRWFEHPEGSVEAPLCDRHPLAGWMFLLAGLSLIPAIAGSAIGILLMPYGWGWLFAELCFAPAMGLWMSFPFFDLQCTAVRSGGVRVFGVGSAFVAAWRDAGAHSRGSAAGRQRLPERDSSFDEVLRSRDVRILGAVIGGLFLLLVILLPPFSGRAAPRRAGGVAAGRLAPRGAGAGQVPADQVDAGPPRKVRAPVDPATLPGLVVAWTFDRAAAARELELQPHGSIGKVSGVRGSAARLNGPDAFFEIPASPLLDFQAHEPLAISGWVRTQAPDGAVLSFRLDASGAAVLDVHVKQGRLAATVRADGSEFGEASVGGVPVNDGQWRHFVLQRLPTGEVELYVDGLRHGPVQGGHTAGSITTNWRALGCELYWLRKDSMGQPFLEAAIDEIAIFKRLLKPHEIAALSGRDEVRP
ncbi:MAG: LamG domain-containing protein [Pirellulaceae bacterium]|nr:LamG domain-containing protein [Pirellulaceae bacterium]